jgi:hypothetical protein
MLIDPVQYWQELTENYRQMGDEELRELAANPDDLTEVARQVLRDEMKKRGLDGRKSTAQSLPSMYISRKNFDLSDPLANTYVVPTEPDGSEQEDDLPLDYTWKTVLCECNESVEAEQLAEALQRAGIESWVEALPPYSVSVGNPRVLVPADRLEEARAVAAKPIPQDIIDFSKTEVPEFELPDCPRCGANDPVLEGTEPLNSWLCEACGARWSDAEEAGTGVQ